MFVRHGETGLISGPADDIIQVNNRAGAITIGMLVDMLTQDPKLGGRNPQVLHATSIGYRSFGKGRTVASPAH